MRSTLDILVAARARIAEPARWCTGALAVDSHDRMTRPESLTAYSWCAIGSICAESGAMNNVATRAAVCAMLPDCSGDPFGYLSGVNDHDGHAAVLALFDRAISRLS